MCDNKFLECKNLLISVLILYQTAIKYLKEIPKLCFIPIALFANKIKEYSFIYKHSQNLGKHGRTPKMEKIYLDCLTYGSTMNQENDVIVKP